MENKKNEIQPKSLKERLAWLEKNDAIFKAEKQIVLEALKELKLKQKK